LKNKNKLINTPNKVNIYSNKIFGRRQLHSLLLIYKTSFQLEISCDTKDENYRKAQVELANDKEEAFNAKMIIWNLVIFVASDSSQ